MKEHVVNKTANDQRSNCLNPNSLAYRAGFNNHSNQMNPNNPAHKARLDNRANQLNPNNRLFQGTQAHDKKVALMTPPKRDKR
jgi:hypothetical protein